MENIFNLAYGHGTVRWLNQIEEVFHELARDPSLVFVIPPGNCRTMFLERYRARNWNRMFSINFSFYKYFRKIRENLMDVELTMRFLPGGIPFGIDNRCLFCSRLLYGDGTESLLFLHKPDCNFFQMQQAKVMLEHLDKIIFLDEEIERVRKNG